MASTRKQIADQIMLRISRGYHDSSSAVQLPDVLLAVTQKINEYVKQSYYTNTLQMGETIPDGMYLTTIEGIKVVPFNDRSKCTLPVMPVGLPFGMGVFEVSALDRDNKCNPHIQFIPLQPGQAFLLKGQDFISDLVGNVGYEQRGFDLIFTKNLLDRDIETVSVTLLLPDMGKLSDYEPLPIDPSVVAAIVEALVPQFQPYQTNDDEVDNLNTEKGGKQ